MTTSKDNSVPASPGEPPTAERFGSTPASLGCSCDPPPRPWMYMGWHHEKSCRLYSPPPGEPPTAPTVLVPTEGEPTRHRFLLCAVCGRTLGVSTSPGRVVCTRCPGEPPTAQDSEHAERLERLAGINERYKPPRAGRTLTMYPSDSAALRAGAEALRQLEYASDDLAFLDKVRAENARLRERVSALKAALHDMVESSVEFEDARMDYVVMQVDRVSLDAARAALADAAQEGTDD